MRNMNNFVEHIEHLGFYVLMKLEKDNESIFLIEDSMLLISNISKIRKILKSNYNCNLTWTQSTITLNNNEISVVKFSVKKESEKVSTRK